MKPRSLVSCRAPDDTTYSTLAFYLVFIGLALYLPISSSLLEAWGIPYDIPGGSPLAKFHPGTYCVAFGFLLHLLSSHDSSRLEDVRLASVRRAMMGFLIGALATAFYSLLRFGSNGSAFFVDTLIAPGLLGVVLLAALPIRQRQIFRLLLIVLSVNALLGIVEVALQDRLVPYTVSGAPVIEDFFRATALGGHPLSNAQRTVLILLAGLIHRDRRQLFLIPVFYLAFFAFGSRGAFAGGGTALGSGLLRLRLRLGGGQAPVGTRIRLPQPQQVHLRQLLARRLDLPVHPLVHLQRAAHG
ncbi:MAG: hypothetical protein WCP34_14795, partial [Pseudomonadota bacterium]